MKRGLLLVSLLCALFPAWAQNVQWASKVVDASSSRSQSDYNASQLLGPPNVMPAGGDNPKAWSPNNGDRMGFVTVEFTTPMAIDRVVIAESMNPGYVREVVLKDATGKEQSITDIPAPSSNKPRMLEVNFPATTAAIRQVRVNLKPLPANQSIGIDGVGILNTKVPIAGLTAELQNSGNPDVRPLPLPLVNSQHSEKAPIITYDGRVLYFIRENHPDNIGGTNDTQDIWYSILGEDNVWGKPQRMGEPLNNEEYNFVVSVLADGNTLFLGNEYKRDGTMGPGISSSRRTQAGWTFPDVVSVPKLQNTSDRANYFVSPSGKVMILSIQRKDSYGGRDLYVSFHKEGNVWTEPQNLGKTVNTSTDDFTPFLAADERTLYYSTSGFPGQGKADIFVTRRIGENWTEWTQPENLGGKVNTPNDDFGFTIPARGDFCYFSSDFEKPGDYNIYKFLLPKSQRPGPIALIKGRVLDKETNQPVGAQIYYEDLRNGNVIGYATSNPTTGEYQINLPAGRNYGYYAEADKYLSLNANMDLRLLDEYKEINKDLLIVPIKVGATITLNNIFFDFNKADLKPESFPELDRLVETLQKNANVSVSITGHTDDVGSDEYNMRLSEHRAKAVEKYITSKGIKANRVRSDWKGKRMPIADNGSEEGRAQNRRVEFKIEKI